MRAPLPDKVFDVVVVGGGVVGVSIARAAAMAGKSTLLVDQNDFASGATSRSLRVVGDIFPDLERGDFSVAREVLRERERLLAQRSHLVRPMPGVVVLGRHPRRSKLEVRFGLWLRRRLGNTLQRKASDADVQQLKQMTVGHVPTALLSFDDAVCEFPERLVAEWLRECIAAGAVARNYSRVLAVSVKEGKAAGITLRDLCTGCEQFIAAKSIVNATGSSAEQLCAESRVQSPPVASLRVVHIAFRRLTDFPEAAIHFEGTDGREVLLTPWNGQHLLGSVRGQSNHLHPAGVTEAELEYLYGSFRNLFPQADPHMTAGFAATVSAPLDGAFTSQSTGNRSLVHSHSEAQGLLTVCAGSLAAAAFTASECARRLGFRTESDPNCEFLPGRANGMETTVQQWAHTVYDSMRIPEATARSIAAWHGRGALCIARLAARSPELRMPLCSHSAHIVAEAVDAVRYECALTLADMLMRRLPIALSPCWSEECTRTAANRIGKVLQWNDAQIALQADQLEAERAAFVLAASSIRRMKDTLAA